MSADETTNDDSSRGNGNQKTARSGGNNQGQERTEEPEGEDSSDSTSDNNYGGNGAAPKMKKRPREEVGSRKGQERSGRNGSDHMNDSFPSGPKESSEEGKEGDGGGRTCVSCRKSKVKCSKGSPCKRCSRLKLECVAQVRGRGRPVASGGSSAAKKSGKSEGKGGGIGNNGGGGGGGRDSIYPGSSNSSSGSSNFLAQRGSGILLSSSNQSAFRAGGEGVPTVGGVGANSVDTRNSFGFPTSSTGGGGVAPPFTATGLSCPPSLGYNAPPSRGSSSVADDVGAALGGGGGGGGGGSGFGYGYQDVDSSSRSYPSHLLSSVRPLPSAAAQHPQQHGSFPAARSLTHPLLHGGSGGSSGASDGGGAPPARMATVPGRPRTASTAGRGSISSGGSWRAVFHADGIGAGARAKGSSSLSTDGGVFGGFSGKDLTWAETIDEHKDAVAAAAAAADGEEFLTRSTDDKARWLMDVEQYAGASAGDSDARPEALAGEQVLVVVVRPAGVAFFRSFEYHTLREAGSLRCGAVYLACDV